MVGAVVLATLACVAGVLLLTRSKQSPIVDDDERDVFEGGNERSAQIANLRQPIVETAHANSEQRNADADDTLPVWARSPGAAWTMPFPEGGRYNPPLPPVQLLPEMIGEVSAPAGSDAGAPPAGSSSTPRDGGRSTPPDGGTSTDGQQLDVEDDHALR